MTQEFLEEYVLENRVNDEPQVDYRPVFSRELAPRIRGLLSHIDAQRGL